MYRINVDPNNDLDFRLHLIGSMVYLMINERPVAVAYPENGRHYLEVDETECCGLDIQPVIVSGLTVFGPNDGCDELQITEGH